MLFSKTGRRIAPTAVAAFILLVAGSAPASAYTSRGHIGTFTEGGETCYVNPEFPANNRVIVQPPAMSSSPVADHSVFTVGGSTNGGGFHIQQVGYRAHLYKWNGRAWADTGRYGPLIHGQTGDDLQPVLWRDGSSTWFSTPGRGYYKVVVALYWFADRQAGGGTLSFTSTLYEQGRRRYCAF